MNVICCSYLVKTEEHGGCWPLDERTQDFLIVNNVALVNQLNSDDNFISRLSATNCFTPRQLQSISQITDLFDKNRKLLDMLSRSSIDHFNQLIQCLQETQPDLVQLLTGEKGTRKLVFC